MIDFTFPSTKRHLQVAQVPTLQSCGKGIPADNAPCSNVWFGSTENLSPVGSTSTNRGSVVRLNILASKFAIVIVLSS
ncbi:hypothetical protein JCM16163A_47410 [Paenibacillus sp. YK5]|nr:hypothetical protein PN4B1_30930 [Paenibacillus naphthalenovorans]